MTQKLTKRQAAIIGAYTGFAASNFSYIQEYAEQLLSRPVFTHEFGCERFAEKLREAARQDFIDICYDEDD